MKISFKWLCEIVDGLSDIAPADLAHRLTMAGLEVEDILDQRLKWQGIVVGEVLKKDKHPNADKLSLCEVSDGQKSYQVVCGAPNVAAGQKFPFATLGTVMPDGLKIAPVKLRGLESHGMLCSAKELQLSESSQGLLVLPHELVTGKPLAAALGFDDVILTVNVTPNRGDALSHWGVARDVAALTGLSVRFDQILPGESIGKIPNDLKPTFASDLKVRVEAPLACPRYTASRISGVKTGESPQWLKSRLEAVGVRSINTVVDATNYVMMLTGQPVHAFDARFIKDQTLVVRSLAQPLSFKTLDEDEQKLLPNDLVIADSQNVLALAGIMGGLSSGVLPDTTDLVLEVAFFDPDQIRKTSRRLGLQTESSYRFARFVNPESVLQIHKILQQLIVALVGGEVSEIVDVYPKPFQPVSVLLQQTEWERILGISIERSVVQKTLERLSLSVVPHADGFFVTIPVGRSDLTRAIDLIEEIGRIQGLDQIPAEMPRFALRTPEQSAIYQCDEKIKSWLCAQGFYETIHLSFGDAAFFKDVLSADAAPMVSLKNPISEDLSLMRPTLMAHLLTCYKKNRLGREAGLKLFELRKTYHQSAEGYQESYRLCGVYGGNPHGRNRFGLSHNLDFYYGKGLLEELFATVATPLENNPHTQNPLYHPAQFLSWQHKGLLRAAVGAVHPEILQKHKVRDKVYAFEIDMDWLALNINTTKARFQPLSPFPSVYRDLALIVDEGLSYQKILDVLQQHKPNELSQVRLFDCYKGDNLPQGKVSFAFSLVYEAKSESLTDESVNALHFALVDTLRQKLGVELR